MIWHNISDPFGYQWTDNLGNVLTQNDTLYFPSLTAGTISVGLNSIFNNCISEISNEVIPIYDLPQVSINPPYDVCGNQIDLTSNVLNASGDLLDSIFWFNISANSYIGSGTSINGYNSNLEPESSIFIANSAISENGCYNSDTVEFSFHAIPNLSASYTDLCNGQDVFINMQLDWEGNPSPNDIVSGTINFGDGTSQLNPAWNFVRTYPNPGTYSVIYPVESNNGCQDTLNFEIVVQAIPEADINIVPKCVEKADISAELTLDNFQIDSLVWQFPNYTQSNLLTFEQSFPDGGNIDGTLVLWSTASCEFEFPFQFYIEPGIELPELEIPNVITANNDGINDKIIINPLFENCFSYELTILNRWGTKLFTSTSSTQPFEGKDQNGNELVSGVYFYTLSSNQGEKHGFITIIK
jgi:gliding motility-associated-like protein